MQKPRRDGNEPLTPALVRAVSFEVDFGEVGFSAMDRKADPPFFYGRWGSPTVSQLESELAQMEGGAAAVCFASGMAAASGLLLTLLSKGDHLVISDVCYAGVAEFAHQTLPRYGITVTPVDTSDLEAVRAAIAPNTRLIYVESPANPTLRLADIGAISTIAAGASVALAVDSTIATPLGQHPLAMGADYVIHSLTKYLGGHGDVLGGAVVTRVAADADRLRNEAIIHLGSVLAPDSAALLLRSLETFSARMAIHEENARAIATFLSTHACVEAVFYPGAADHPQAELAKSSLANTSGVIAFRTIPSFDPERFIRALCLIKHAVSLGKTASLIYYLPTQAMVRASLRFSGRGADAFRKWAGDGLFRLSVGLEPPHRIIEDLDQAFNKGR